MGAPRYTNPEIDEGAFEKVGIGALAAESPRVGVALDAQAEERLPAAVLGESWGGHDEKDREDGRDNRGQGAHTG